MKSTTAKWEKINWVNDCSGKPTTHVQYCQGCVKVAWITDFELDEIISQAKEEGKQEERERIEKLITDIKNSSYHPEQSWYDALRCVRSSITSPQEQP